MKYRVNVDKLTKSAKIHTVNNHRDCQPKPKQEKDGYWGGPFATREEAFQEAENSGQKIQLCGTCNP